MNNSYIKTFSINILILLLSSITLGVKAQVPIEELVSKYKDLDKLQTFHLTDKELKVSKQISINLNEKDRKLILGTKQQYTLLYTGVNPSLNNFFEETISIVNSKKYIKAKEFNLGELRKITYILGENNKVNEVVNIIKNSNSVSILVSIGDFDINDYQELKK